MNNQNILAIRKSIVLKLVEEIIYARPSYQEIKKEREQYVQYRVKKMLDKKKSGQSLGRQFIQQKVIRNQTKTNNATSIDKTNSKFMSHNTSTQQEILSTSSKPQDQNKKFNEMFIQRKSLNAIPITNNQSNLSRSNTQQSNISKPNATQSITKFQQRKILPISFSNKKRSFNSQEASLPATIRDLRPTPTFTQLDLGKLNPLLKDPTLSVIICEGPNKSINVKRAGEGNRPTQIILNEQEIQDVVQRFSQETRIPFSEGAFRTIVGSNLITANIFPDNKVQNFIITKIAPGR